VSRRILVTGSRNWTDVSAVWGAIEAAIGDSMEVTIVHGACPTGADQFAAEWCEMAASTADRYGRGVFIEERHPARWSEGKSAGPRRNQEMVDLGADVCLAFPLPDSRGTRHCMAAAERAGIPVHVYEPVA
jgi:hypothetical protein